MKNNNLFCPGPVDISINVYNALHYNLISHRSEKFHEIYKNCTNLTKQLFNINDDYVPLFITGSGTVSIESMIYSFLRFKKVLILKNGSFSDKWKDMLDNYSNNYDTLDFGWNNSFCIKKLKTILNKNNYECIFFVHHETSTTMINDIYEINNICNSYNIIMIVDAVSSAGIYDINLSKLNSLYMFSYSTNKCIGSIPGLSVVISKKSILDNMNNNISYLNLKQYYNFSKFNETPFTPCIINFYCYIEAMKNILLNKNNIKSLYDDLMNYFIKRMNTKGYIPVLKSNQCNWVINFKCENPNEIYDKLKSKNITIYRCKGELTNKAIQIAIFNKSYEELEYLIREI